MRRTTEQHHSMTARFRQRLGARRRPAGPGRFNDVRVSAELEAIAERRRAEVWSTRVV